jgi:ribonuclease PH
MTASGRIVEVQATAEGAPFTRGDLDRLIDLGQVGLKSLYETQKQALAELEG